MSVHSIHSLTKFDSFPSLPHARGQFFQNINGHFPVYARVRDADTFFQCGWALGGHFLVAALDVGFDHDTDDSSFACAELRGDGGSDFRLVKVIFEGVTYLRYRVSQTI